MAQLIQAGQYYKDVNQFTVDVAFTEVFVDVPYVVLTPYVPNGQAVGAIETLLAVSAAGFTANSAIQTAYINWIAYGDDGN
jgi:hypothetical protein